ncbi:hypothetical protein HORIV_10040 [Vreelandella olivaria]|uniref:Uncharacterized protein n=1 Tax=Vreelandella olivaria TaxID=390919 RepID=A0ABM7GDQ3_9GAMM|nr:hypothetical protein HORIV_10040 [Halomonas olivaria]
MSPKLGATSEFRSVIQNDFTQLHGNSRDGLKLRQIAAQFSLVNPERRIRHIEKLVSAVHAKEGKMDTLKTMLAAIFEEDGVELPVTRIRNTKARVDCPDATIHASGATAGIAGPAGWDRPRTG